MRPLVTRREEHGAMAANYAYALLPPPTSHPSATNAASARTQESCSDLAALVHAADA